MVFRQHAAVDDRDIYIRQEHSDPGGSSSQLVGEKAQCRQLLHYQRKFETLRVMADSAEDRLEKSLGRNKRIPDLATFPGRGVEFA